MNLTTIFQRKLPPEPWEEGEKIPWNEPAFSARMLQEHISQEHDAASRRSAIIDRQVDWIHRRLLGGAATRILDLGCGPGLYTSRLARLGHTCMGIDFSPASIQYAIEMAEQGELDCRYIRNDIRRAEYGAGYGLVMLLYGELNVFRPDDVRLILSKACRALAPGGLLLLEPHTYEAVRQAGSQDRSWYTSNGGLYSPNPHLVLQESFWHEAQQAITIRYYILEAGGSDVIRYAESMQAYDENGYRMILEEAGFGGVRFHPGLSEAAEDRAPELIAITGRKV